MFRAVTSPVNMTRSQPSQVARAAYRALIPPRVRERVPDLRARLERRWQHWRENWCRRKERNRTPLFAAYMRRYFPSTHGWFIAQSAAIWDCFLTYQSAQRIRGDLLEIGVWKGKSAILEAMHAAAGERLVLVDFQVPDDVQQTIRKVTAASVHVLEMPSQEFRHTSIYQQGAGAYRWIHIDGGHSGPAVRADLESANHLLTTDGIIVVDDFMKVAYPQITRTVFEFLSQHPQDLHLFLCGFNKGYLCRPAKASIYLGFVKDALHTELWKRGFGDVTIFKTARPEDMNCFGISGRSLDYDYCGPDENPTDIRI